MRKEKLLEVIYLSMVGFSDGSHQLVLHRESERRSDAEIAWFTKDPSAFFVDVPDVDRCKLDNESAHIWRTKVPKAGELLEGRGESVVENVVTDAGSVVTEAGSVVENVALCAEESVG